ncbi:MAG: YggS family pyridoxal phosphate-dependent enzyme [Terrimicrobiaceae bacterium]|nr:YggS family pyridoxal phosphate-dependent enzyme [Terrimicrobiaceae bacterium]
MQDLLMEHIGAAHEAVRGRIAAACARAGRAPGSVALVAVSKTQPPEVVRAAHAAGIGLFGENRVQELVAKVPECPSSITWHLIGHLQTNKIRKALPLCALLHGVDSLDLARGIERIAGELGLFPSILVEVNVSGEASKFGVRPESLPAVLEEVLRLRRVELRGLMTIAPLASDPEAARPHFRALRQLRDECAAKLGAPLPELSMGMTGDFEVAVEEGATMVRIGTALFGARPQPGARQP